MPAKRKATVTKDSSANLGFEAKLWLTADKLRNNMDAAEYKHVVLGLIFLKYISDTFEEHRAKLIEGKGDYKGANAEDPDEYKAENVFWVPADARWSHLQASAKQSTIGKTVDDAMVAIERDNPRLKGVLPKDYARPGLDKQRLGELIDVIATIELTAASEGEKTHRSVDLLGRVYEYFLTRFASAEGKNGGQFYTPSCVVRCLVEMLAPYKGRIYDPACGSGGMFVQSEKFVESHGGKLGDISIYGQESNATTRRLAVMNLALRGIEADFGPEHADTFRRDLHPDLRADYVLANPPFNDSDWFRKDDDVRWQFGVPPKGNANFAWVQHFIHHLAPRAWPASSSPTAACPPTSPAKETSAKPSSRPTSWTAWSLYPASSSTLRRLQCACGSWRKISGPQRCMIGAKKRYLSMPARLGILKIENTAFFLTKISAASSAHIRVGAVKKERNRMPMFQVFAPRLQLRKSHATNTNSPRGPTSVLRNSKSMKFHLKRKWRLLFPSFLPNAKPPPNLM
jgi:hypothetical protein